MPLRLSGLVSGMDTEGIVRELMKAQGLKKTRISNKITTLEWKEERWKSLNTKMYSFYTEKLSKLRFEGSFGTKKTSSSHADKVEIKAGTNAPEGTHKVSVHQLASSQFVTGSALGLDKNGKEITAGTKLVDLGFVASEGTTITIAAGKEVTTLDIGTSTTMNDFTNACKKVGLYASYDTTQKRFFISSKDSGNANSFSITTNSSETTQDRNAIRDYINYGAMNDSTKSTVDNALTVIGSDISTEDEKIAARSSIVDAMHAQLKTKFVADYKANVDNVAAAEQEVIDGLEEGQTLTDDEMKAAVNKKLSENAQKAVTEEYDTWKEGTAATGNTFYDAVVKLDELISDYITPSADPITQTNTLSKLGLSEIVRTKDADGIYTVTADPNVKMVHAQDSIMTYNGALIKSSSNTVTANGLTFTLKGLTNDNGTPDDYSDDEAVTLGVTSDTQSVYDMIKDFVKSYNELLKEMNGAYYAESARGYDPLTDEEKDAMTDEQVKNWEEKIKSSLLRRDNTISSIVSSMRTNLSRSVQVDGKSYSLSTFGIATTGYIEKGTLHIQGDSDDPTVGMNENKLMKALTDDPDTVMKVFTQLANQVYKDLSDRMSSTPLRSALSFYNDKEIKSTLKDYKDDLKAMERKLSDMENKYYKQFAAMESAMSKLNSQSSQLASMLGMNQN